LHAHEINNRRNSAITATHSNARGITAPPRMPEKIDSALQNDLTKLVEVAKGRVGVGAVLSRDGPDRVSRS
jgi:hypothetical protein